MKHYEKEFEGILKILQRKWTSNGLDNAFISIAYGEALTKLLTKEAESGGALPKVAQQSFIWVAASNLIKNECKRLQNVDHIGSGEKHINSGAISLDQTIISRIDFDKAIELLPDKYRSIFLLQLNSGLTIKDIAKQVGLSENGVKKRLKVAREKLRRFHSK